MLIVLIVFVILSLVVIVNNNVISLNYKGMTGYSIWLKGTKKKAEPYLFDKVPLLLPSSLNQVPESLVRQHDKDASARVMVVLNNSSPVSPAIGY